MHYQYDGSFTGFLSAVYQAYHDGTSHVEKIESIFAGRSLFSDGEVISSNFDNAEKVINSLCKKCGAKTAHTLYYAFMAEQPECEMSLFYYIRCAFHYKKMLPYYKRDPLIQQVERWSLKTGNERYRMLGLLRFSELTDGMLYASIRPDYNIVPLMAGHFAHRMASAEWAIHDLHRHIAAYYNKHNIIIADVTKQEKNIKYSRDEQEFRRIWCQYYRSIGIKERKNPDLRRSFMPKKYWAYITELANGQAAD